MWRFHFTADDLARTRVAQSLGPLAETMFGLVTVRADWPVPGALLGWRDRMRPLLTSALMPLIEVAPRRTLGLDLWTLTGEAPTIEQGLSALKAMRPGAIREELSYFSSMRALPSHTWRLADKDATARRELAGAAQVAYRTMVEPYWGRVSAHLEAQRMACSRDQLDGGIERMFSRLFAGVRWTSPVLEVPSHSDMDIHLDGRGLILVPSLFVGDMPVLLTDSGPPKLVFPVAGEETSLALLSDGPVPQKLGNLLGNNRSRVLAAIGAGCTTTELSVRAQISLSAASQHANVLRRAGLISTHREGKVVCHSLTQLGKALLDRTG